jgi:hypothetical protein
MTSALVVLRGKQVGFSLDEMDELTWGQLMDVLIESANDNYKYPIKGTAADFNKLMGIE